MLFRTTCILTVLAGLAIGGEVATQPAKAGFDDKVREALKKLKERGGLMDVETAREIEKFF